MDWSEQAEQNGNRWREPGRFAHIDGSIMAG